MADINAAMLDNTLGDGASVAEMFRRQGQFAADRDVAEDLRLQGQRIFNTALFTATPAAMEAGQPVSSILRHTVESIDALYSQNEQREASFTRTADGSAVSWRPEVVDLDDKTTHVTLPAPQEPTGNNDHAEKEPSTSSSVYAAIEAQQKLPLETHDKPGHMPAAAGVVKALKRTSRGSRSSFMVSSLQDSEGKVIADMMSRDRSDDKVLNSRPRNKKIHWSLVVKLKISKECLLAHGTGVQEKMPVKTRATGGVRVEQVKSDESDMGDMDDKMDENASHCSPRAHKTKKSPLTTISRGPALGGTSDEDEDEEMRDVDEPTPATPRSRSVRRHSSRAHFKPRDSGKEDAPRKLPNLQSQLAKRPRITTQPSTPKDLNTRLTPSLASKTWSTTHTSTSTPAVRSTLSKPTQAYKFPPYPALDARKRSPFHLGASIALSNILEDSVLNPSNTLAELIDELEENRPTVEGWEMKSRLKGGEWVYACLRGVGGMKKKGGNVRALVGALEVWEGREWVRVGGREKEKVPESEEEGSEEDDDEMAE